MAITLKRTTDMPLDANGKRIISGAHWDTNATTLETAINGGLDSTNLAASANIAGTQMAANTVARSNAKADFDLLSLMYWIDL